MTNAGNGGLYVQRVLPSTGPTRGVAASVRTERLGTLASADASGHPASTSPTPTGRPYASTATGELENARERPVHLGRGLRRAGRAALGRVGQRERRRLRHTLEPRGRRLRAGATGEAGAGRQRADVPAVRGLGRATDDLFAFVPGGATAGFWHTHVLAQLSLAARGHEDRKRRSWSATRETRSRASRSRSAAVV